MAATGKQEWIVYRYAGACYSGGSQVLRPQVRHAGHRVCRVHHSLWQIIFIFLLSALKFGFGGVPRQYLQNSHFLRPITITTAGGVAGAILFANISQWALENWYKLMHKLFSSRRNRSITLADCKLARFIKEKWGLVGIAFFTPFILSIPIGTALAVHFYRDKQKVISYMLVSIACWDILLYVFYNNFYHVIGHYIRHHLL